MMKKIIHQTLVFFLLINTNVFAEKIQTEIEKKSFSVRIKTTYGGAEQDKFYLKTL